MSSTVASPDPRPGHCPKWLALLGKAIHYLAMLIGYAIYAFFSFFALRDVVIALNPVGMHRNIEEYTNVRVELPTSEDLLIPRDFDGDGVDDILTCVGHSVRRQFSRNTWRLLRVESGSSGEVLLVHELPFSAVVAGWCPDYDGNGTMDILVKDGRSLSVLCHVREKQ